MRRIRLTLVCLIALAGADIRNQQTVGVVHALTPRAAQRFDVRALLEGASSDVPDDALAAYPAILGGSLTRHTAITGIEFHIPGVISSEALSSTPIPLQREVNGVTFWQVTGEISARIVDDIGTYRLIGPIDSRGVSHRAETFDPYEPTAENPNDAASHPRAGLPGAFFSIQWPASGFNGAIIHVQAAADGGYAYPQAPLAWMPVDAGALLEAGYAIVTVGTGSTVYARKNADGTETMDSNPESGSGIFWTEDFELRPDDGVWETGRVRLVPNTRPAFVDAEFDETPVDAHRVIEIYVPEWNRATGQYGLVVQDPWYVNPYISWPVAQWHGPELIRDAAVVFKNFLTQATGAGNLWSCYLGWSGSGNAAWQLASGKQNNALFSVPHSYGSAPNAGNFNRWRDPASGRRFDAFVVYAGVLPWPWFNDDTDVDAAQTAADVDPEYPIGAPYVFIHGDADLAVSQINPYVQANAVARAWGGSRMASQSIDDYISILHLDRVNHQQRDQIFTTWDRPSYRDSLWWDPALGGAPESLNTERRGLRITEPYARIVAANGNRNGLAGYANDLDPFPRITPLYFALLETLRNGAPLPRSRVDPDIFDNLDRIRRDTKFPLYDQPCNLTDQSPWDEIIACRDRLRNDATAWGRTLLPGEFDALQFFASSNPLSRSTERLQLPDVAAPLGWWYFFYGVQIRRDFTNAELTSRYGTTEGYLRAWEDASNRLIAQRLWHRGVARLYIESTRARAPVF